MACWRWGPSDYSCEIEWPDCFKGLHVQNQHLESPAKVCGLQLYRLSRYFRVSESLESCADSTILGWRWRCRHSCVRWQLCSSIFTDYGCRFYKSHFHSNYRLSRKASCFHRSRGRSRQKAINDLLCDSHQHASLLHQDPLAKGYHETKWIEKNNYHRHWRSRELADYNEIWGGDLGVSARFLGELC